MNETTEPLQIAPVSWFDALPVVVWTATADGRVDYTNARWTDVTGMAPETSYGAGFLAAHHPDDVERVAAGWAHAVARRERYASEQRLRTAHGDFRWQLVVAEPVTLSDGALRWFGTIIDIDDQKRAEAERVVLLQRDYQREQGISDSYQRASLPLRLPEVPGLRFDAVYMAGDDDFRVGGDWYDAVRLPDGRVVISIGDVAGHGLAAAVIMGNIRQIVRGIAQVHADPALMLEAADRALRLEHSDVFVTAFVAVYDPVTCELSYASAGHPPPLVRRPDGEVVALDMPALPLGLRVRDGTVARSTLLAPGSLLVLYTDGLTEASRQPLDGEARLIMAVRTDAVAQAAHPARAITSAVLRRSRARDDVAVLTIAVEASAGDDVPNARRWRFAVDDLASAHVARREFRELLQRRGYPADAIHSAELVFGELLGNVVRYAPGHVDMVIDWSGVTPVLHVLDEGPGFQHLSAFPPVDLLSESGRGLFIISALTDDFHVARRSAGGSHARAVLRL